MWACDKAVSHAPVGNERLGRLAFSCNGCKAFLMYIHTTSVFRECCSACPYLDNYVLGFDFFIGERSERSLGHND